MSTHYPILHGFDVSVGTMQREYIPIATAGINNPDVTRGLLIKPPITLESEYAWYDKPNNKDLIFAILLHEKDVSGAITGYRYIGHTGLHNLTWPDGHAVSGTVIIDPLCFGKGYGKEAKMLLLFEAFLNRGLRKVCSYVKAFNGNSWGHLLACGYTEVGRHRKHHFYNGKFVDEICLEVFRQDWEPLWHSYRETKMLPRLTDEQRLLLQKETDTV